MIPVDLDKHMKRFYNGEQDPFNTSNHLPVTLETDLGNLLLPSDEFEFFEFEFCFSSHLCQLWLIRD